MNDVFKFLCKRSTLSFYIIFFSLYIFRFPSPSFTHICNEHQRRDKRSSQLAKEENISWVSTIYFAWYSSASILSLFFIVALLYYKRTLLRRTTSCRPRSLMIYHFFCCCCCLFKHFTLPYSGILHPRINYLICNDHCNSIKFHYSRSTD